MSKSPNDRIVRKCVSIPLGIAVRLEEEDNQSQTVREALEEYWDDE